MATNEWSDEECDDGSAILSTFDEDAEKILVQIGARPREDISNELLESFDKQELRNLRARSFELVREKAVRCLLSPTANGFAGPDDAFVKHHQTPLSRSFIDQWEPVNRRLESKLAYDIVAYMAFALGYDNQLPEKLIKGLSLDKGSLTKAGDECENRLCEDLANADSEVRVEIVQKSAEKETHLVTIDNSVAAPTTSPTATNIDVILNPVVEPTGSATLQPKETTGDTEHSDNGTVVVNGDKPAVDETPDITTTSSSEPARTEKTATSASDPVSNPPPKQQKKFVDMACQTICSGEYEKPISRAEFEMHMDYVEKMCRETKDRVKKIEEWKVLIDNKDKDRSDPQSRSVGSKSRPISLSPPVDAVSQRPSTSSAQVSRRESDSMWDMNLTGTDGSSTSDVRTSETKKKGEGVNKSSRRIRRLSASMRRRGMKSALSKHLVKRKEFCAEQVPPENHVDVYNDQYERSKDCACEKGPENPRIKKSGAVKPANPKRAKGNPPMGDRRNQSDIGRQQAKQKGDYSCTSSASDSRKTGTAPKDSVRSKDRPSEKQNTTGRNNHKQQFRDGDEDLPPPPKKQSGQRFSFFSKKPDEIPVLKSTSGGHGSHQESPESSDDDMSSNEQTLSQGDISESGSDSSDTVSCIDLEDDVSYATVAAKDRWHTATGGKRKRGKTPPMSMPILRSAPSTRKRELYVQELDYSTCRCQEDLEDIVYYHCKTRSMKPIDLCTIPVKKSRTVAGCKVTVLEKDYARASQESFWPAGCTVRDWVNKPKDQRQSSTDGQDSL